ncbi:aldehyde dehydrogenase family protein [Arthrobacter sp. SF27]|nr:aldehyde dehydrogenase family protein [Arthrobacter sp. SF27]
MTNEHYSKFYINGSWVPARGSGQIDVISPVTEDVIASVPAGNADDVNAAVAAASEAFPQWASTSVDKRAAYLRAIASGMKERSDELAHTITSEMGTTIDFASAMQVPMAIQSFALAADIAEAYQFERNEGSSTIIREPVGVVGAITPWNFPLHQIAGKVAYALAGGSTIVVKSSEIAPLSACLLAEIIDSTGLPEGVFNLLTGTGAEAGEPLVSHPDVDMVSFTGSTRAGKRVTALAGETIKRVSLELGGKSANVVLDDADIDELMPHAMQWAYLNGGQACAALTRLVVPRQMLGRAEKAAKDAAESLQVGDPTTPGVQLGPLVSKVQQDRVRSYIEQGVKEGAKLITGGSEPVPGLESGYYVKPTVFSEVTPEMTIHREEIFGPVLSIVPYDTDEDAVRIANDTPYGLAGAVWSKDTDRARTIAGQVRTGQIAINGGDFSMNAPFGGYKQSGNGREFGVHGLEEFLEIKSLQY